MHAHHRFNRTTSGRNDNALSLNRSADRIGDEMAGTIPAGVRPGLSEAEGCGAGSKHPVCKRPGNHDIQY